jgi:CubicO group peptidase (beta-lactamase class C family)
VFSLEAVGWLDIAQRKPMRTDALFWIASQSKSMTAAALMMLVDEGRVNLDDPVEKYLPEFKGQMLAVEQDADHVLLRKPVHPITVREILSQPLGPARDPPAMPRARVRVGSSVVNAFPAPLVRNQAARPVYGNKARRFIPNEMPGGSRQGGGDGESR